MVLFLKQGYDKGLLVGCKPGEYLRAQYCLAQLCGVHALKFRSADRATRVYAYLTGYGLHHGIVVARQYLHFNAMLVQPAYGTCCRGLGRIEKGKIADKHHAALVGNAEVTVLAEITLVRHRKHTHSLSVHTDAYLQCPRPQFRSERMHSTLILGMRADGEHLLDGSLCYNLTLAGLILHHHRHPAPGEVERYLIHFSVIVFQVFQRKIPHMRQDGLVHKIL